MANQRQSKAYILLAVEAGRRCGLNMPTPAAVKRLYGNTADKNPLPPEIDKAAKAVAAAESVREVRDGLWMEYERMLRDGKTYQQLDVLRWLEANNAKTSPASVNRNSMTLRREIDALRMRAELARDMKEAAASGEGDFLAAARTLTTQHYFLALQNLSPDALADLTATQVLRLLEAVGGYAVNEASADFKRAKIDELTRKTECEMKALAAKAGGAITDEDIKAATRSIFGGA